jgi:hypothetical protein
VPAIAWRGTWADALAANPIDAATIAVANVLGNIVILLRNGPFNAPQAASLLNRSDPPILNQLAMAISSDPV